jgi:pyruvate/2-oxoglutarate dehydrogenase complex dihydrolipoamide acyltransferase (E2) component
VKPKVELDTFINQRRLSIGAFHRDRMAVTVHCNVDVDMSAAIGYRRRFKQQRPEVRLTFNDMIIKAAANALGDFPQFVGFYDGRFGLYPAESIDICFSIDGGENFSSLALVRQADTKSLAEISAAARASVEERTEKVGQAVARLDRRFKRFPRLLPAGVWAAYNAARMLGLLVPPLKRWSYRQRMRQRGSFAISNIGPAGVRQMEGPVFWPDVLQLMIAAIRPKTRLIDGRLESRPTMPLIAKFDHRMTDVAPASRFLHAVRRNLEQPETRLGPYD